MRTLRAVAQHMIEEWIQRYFPEEQLADVLALVSGYGTETWHREAERFSEIW